MQASRGIQDSHHFGPREVLGKNLDIFRTFCHHLIVDGPETRQVLITSGTSGRLNVKGDDIGELAIGMKFLKILAIRIGL